jgi:hypothetical protein
LAELSPDFITAIDGGICVNQPYLCGVTEAVSMYPSADAFLVVSFGTGEYNDVSVKKAPSTILGWAVELPDMFIGGESKMAFHILKTLGSLYNKEIYFMRVQMKLPKEYMTMDNASPSNIEYLKQAALEFSAKNSTALDLVSSVLAGTEKTPRNEIAKVPEEPIISKFVHIGKNK